MFQATIKTLPKKRLVVDEAVKIWETELVFFLKEAATRC